MIKKNLASIKKFTSLPIDKLNIGFDILKEKIQELIVKEIQTQTYQDFDTTELLKSILKKISIYKKGIFSKEKCYVSLKGLIIYKMKRHLKIVPEYDLNKVLEDNSIYKWIINDEKLVYSKKYKEDRSGLSKVFHTDLTNELVCDYAGEFKYSDGNIIFNLDSGRFSYQLNKGMDVKQEDLDKIKGCFIRIFGDIVTQADNLFKEFKR